MKIPNSPFSTRLSGSAKETELRIRNIFQWKKKRPPVIALVAAVLIVVLCGSLVAFTPENANVLTVTGDIKAMEVLQLSDSTVYAVADYPMQFTLYWMAEGQEPEAFYEVGHWGRPNLSMEEVRVSGNRYLAIAYVYRYRDDGRILDKKYVEVFYIPDAGVPVYIHRAENVPYPAVRNKSIKEIVQYADANLDTLLGRNLSNGTQHS